MKKATKKLTQALLATALLAGIAAPSAGAAPTFKDVPKTNVHYDDIYNLTDREVLTGYPDGTYKPAENLTRAEAAAILTKALDLDTSYASNPRFKDVKKTAWYYDEIAILTEMGILNGYGDGRFGPNDKLTRAQMASILTNAYSLLTFGGETPFTDVDPFDWFGDAVHALYYFDVTKGVSETKFAPKDFVRRDAMASFVVRAESISEEQKAEAFIDLFVDFINESPKGLFTTSLNKTDNIITVAVTNSDKTVRELIRTEIFLMVPYALFFDAHIVGQEQELNLLDQYELKDQFLEAMEVTEATPLNDLVGKSVSVEMTDMTDKKFTYTYQFVAK